MTTTPVERVAQLLEGAQYKRMTMPFEIGGLEVDASAAFFGTPPSPDLIVVGDTLEQTPRRMQQAIEGVGRALDMMGSRRPLTLVVVGPRPESAALTALSRHARVLPVGELADESSLANWLAVLLPLTLPSANASRAEAAIDKLLRSVEEPLAREFINLAAQGEVPVAARLAALVDEPCAKPDDGEEG